jgi:hypothetical protein
MEILPLIHLLVLHLMQRPAFSGVVDWSPRYSLAEEEYFKSEDGKNSRVFNAKCISIMISILCEA